MITKNELKYYSSLLKKKFRDKENKFIIEGKTILEEAVKSGNFPEIILVTNNFYEKEQKFLKKISIEKFRLEKLKNQEFLKISSVVSSQGVVSILKKFNTSKKKLASNQIIFLERISDPGNVGTILRNCDWFGIKEIILSKECADVFNPKTVRASMGSVFHVNILENKDLSFLFNLKDENYKIFSADLEGENIYKFKFPEKFVIAFSNEAAGPSEELLKISDQKITIPKFGNAESLNVASSSAVILSGIKN